MIATHLTVQTHPGGVRLRLVLGDLGLRRAGGASTLPDSEHCIEDRLGFQLLLQAIRQATVSSGRSRPVGLKRPRKGTLPGQDLGLVGAVTAVAARRPGVVDGVGRHGELGHRQAASRAESVAAVL